MKIRNWLLLAVSLVPARASTQGRSVSATRTVFASMQRNVGRITRTSAERARWDANVTMWRIALPGRGVVGENELTLLEAALERMKGNVDQITAPGEQQRWQANVVLWQAFVEGDRAPTKRHDAVFRAFDTMKKNVARLSQSPEKRRWQANIDLWQSMFARQP